MADGKISDDATVTPADADLVPVIQGGLNKKSTIAAIAARATANGAQPLDSELTALAALTTTAYGRSVLEAADAAALRTLTGLVIGTNVQAFDSDLAAIAALTTTAFGRALLELADAAALRTAGGLGGLAVLSAVTASLISDASANGRSLITAADYSAMRTLLGLVIGTNVQAQDAELAALAGLTSAADKGIHFTGSGTAAVHDLTSFIRGLLDDADAATARATLGAAAAIAEGRPKAGAVISYTLPGVETFAATTLAVSANVIRYFPILVVTPITLDQLAVEVTAAGAGSTTARLGIFNADADWQPGTLVVDGGTVATDSTGVKTATINTTLQPGRYLLALNSDGGATLRGRHGGTRYAGFPAAIGAAFMATMTKSLAYAAFGSPGTAWDTQLTSSGFIYIVFCRVSTP
jgi:hypothetical protein